MTAQSELDIMRKRLRFRAWHRGLQEADLFIGTFVDNNLEQFDADDCTWFEGLLEYPDIDILNWVSGKDIPPEALKGRWMTELTNFRLPPLTR